MSSSENILKKISDIARATRQYVLGLSDDEESNPYDLNNYIKESMGIQIFYASKLPFDGCVKWNEASECPMMIISQDDSYYRQEFTIAHELGHLLLHWKWSPGTGLDEKAKSQAKHQYNIMGVLYRYPEHDDNPIEQQANEFAADFLMPKKGVQTSYKAAHVKNLDAIKFNVSSQFNVSTDAAYNRLKNLKERKEIK